MSIQEIYRVPEKDKWDLETAVALNKALTYLHENSLSVEYTDTVPTELPYGKFIVYDDDSSAQRIYFKTASNTAGTINYADKNVAAATHTGDVTGDTDLTIAAGAVDTAMVNTATGTASGSADPVKITITGGDYCFAPQVKASASASTSETIILTGGVGKLITIGTTFLVQMLIATVTHTLYAHTRYITGTGTDHWTFLYTNKNTGKIIATSTAPDHVMYGNGNDINVVPHPFTGNDYPDMDVCILPMELNRTLIAKGIAEDRDVCNILHEDFDVELGSTKPYDPVHTGQWTGTGKDRQKVMLGSLPGSVVVRDLKELTTGQKLARKQEELDRTVALEAAKQGRKTALMNKFNFTEQDLAVLKEL